MVYLKFNELYTLLSLKVNLRLLLVKLLSELLSTIKLIRLRVKMTRYKVLEFCLST